jgi:hypothetical protein
MVVVCAGCVENEKEICKTANNILTGASDGTVPLITVDANHRSECRHGCAVSVYVLPASASAAPPACSNVAASNICALRQCCCVLGGRES